MKVGSLFSALGLLFASFMMGTCIGVVAGRRIKDPNTKHGAWIQGLMLCLCTATGIFWPLSMYALPVPFVLNALMGILVGMVFTLFSRLVSRKTNSMGGILYGFDLAGAAAGGILTSLYFIPYAGVAVTFAFLGILAGVCMVFLVIGVGR